MRILHVFKDLKYSGAEIMYVDAAPFFRAMGSELSVLDTGSGNGDFKSYFLEAGFHFHHIGISNTKNLYNWYSFFRRVSKLIKENKYDVIHVHRSDLMFTVAILCYINKISCVYSVHNVFKSGRLTKLWHRFQRRLAQKNLHLCVHTISDSVYYNELDYYGINSYKIYNWINFDRFSILSNEQRINIRKSFGIRPEQKVIISIGGCSHVKRHTDVLLAMSVLKKSIPDIVYLHLGSGVDEPEEQLLASQLGLKENVRFLGNQKSIGNYLGISDLYVMTSKFEGISLTTIEAMAMMVPTILYNVPGLSDFNNDGRFISYTIEPYVELLTEKILELFQDQTDSSNMVNAAYHYCKSNYDLESNAKQIFELYKLNVY